MDGKGRCVDDLIGDFPDGGKAFHFFAYGLFQTDTLPFKRMGTAGCGIAPHDDGRIRLQIKDLCAESHAGQPMQRLIKFAHELAAPLIETESYAMRRLNGGALQKAHHFGHEFRRHPVRGEQAHVLEDMEHSTFARAGEAGDDENRLIRIRFWRFRSGVRRLFRGMFRKERLIRHGIFRSNRKPVRWRLPGRAC